MIGTSQLINAFGAPVCFTDTTDIFKDRSGVALYGLDYDASDAGGASGKFGEAAIFNGTTSNISIPTLGGSFYDSDFSISLWVNLNSLGGTSTGYLFSGAGSRDVFINFNTGDSGGGISARLYDGAIRDVVYSSAVAGQWYHVVFVRSKTNGLNLYVDGVSRDTNSYTGNAQALSFTSDGIGGRVQDRNTTDGKIDQVRIYNTALTQSQVTQLYQENDSTLSQHLFGCLATYNFDGSAKESLGTTAYDGTETDITYRYDGTPTDVDFGVGGKSNYGARFNGSSSYIDVSSLTYLFDSKATATVSLWFNTSTTATTSVLFSDYASSTARNFLVSINSTGNIVWNTRYGSGTGRDSNITTTSTYNDGNWHHIVLSIDQAANAKSMYVDGSPIGSSIALPTATGESFDSTQRVTMGSSYNTGTSAYQDYYNGTIDQVRIFSKALSSSEVSKLYRNGAGEIACTYTSTTDSSNIGGTNQAYYKFDNDVLDYSGNGNNGTSSSIEFGFGRFGQAAIGDGSTRNFVNPQPFNTGDTISFWTRRRDAGADSHAIFGQHDGTYDFFTCRVYYNSDNTHKIQFFIRNSTSSYKYTQTSYTTDNGNWSHWVVTFNSPSSYPTVYLNTEEQSLSINNANGSMSSYAQSNARIGRAYINGTLYNMNGYLDQMRTFTSARTVEQITELYNEKQFLTLDTITEPTGNLRFDEFWASYDDGQTNRAEFKSGGQIVDFNTYSEGHAVLNQNAQTSGKYYLEIQLLGIQATEAEFVGVFNRSSNTVYDSPGYFSKNPVDGNYGAGISHEGSLVRIGNSQETGFTDLNIGVNDIYCLAVDVDDKRIWFGRRDGLSGNSITWNKGNPNGLYGGLKVNFVPSDVIVAHLSETYQRYAEFKVLDHADMLEPPLNFSYLNGAFTPSLTENESAH